MSADKLKPSYGVFGHFYSVELASKEVIECRSVLEIANHDHTPTDHTELSALQSASNGSTRVRKSRGRFRSEGNRESSRSFLAVFSSMNVILAEAARETPLLSHRRSSKTCPSGIITTFLKIGSCHDDLYEVQREIQLALREKLQAESRAELTSRTGVPTTAEQEKSR